MLEIKRFNKALFVMLQNAFNILSKHLNYNALNESLIIH